MVSAPSRTGRSGAWAIVVALAAVTGCSTRQLTPEEHCCKHKARHQAQFARSLGLSPPAPIVYRKYYDKCMAKQRCRQASEEGDAEGGDR